MQTSFPLSEMANNWHWTVRSRRIRTVQILGDSFCIFVPDLNYLQLRNFESQTLWLCTQQSWMNFPSHISSLCFLSPYKPFIFFFTFTVTCHAEFHSLMKHCVEKKKTLEPLFVLNPLPTNTIWYSLLLR